LNTTSQVITLSAKEEEKSDTLNKNKQPSLQ
jgi:hypothetical protein